MRVYFMAQIFGKRFRFSYWDTCLDRRVRTDIIQMSHLWSYPRKPHISKFKTCFSEPGPLVFVIHILTKILWLIFLLALLNLGEFWWWVSLLGGGGGDTVLLILLSYHQAYFICILECSKGNRKVNKKWCSLWHRTVIWKCTYVSLIIVRLCP